MIKSLQKLKDKGKKTEGNKKGNQLGCVVTAFLTGYLDNIYTVIM